MERMYPFNEAKKLLIVADDYKTFTEWYETEEYKKPTLNSQI